MEKFKSQKIQDQPVDNLQKRFEGKLAGGGEGEGRVEIYEDEEEEKKKKRLEELIEEWEKKKKELSALWGQVRSRANDDPDFARKLKTEVQEFVYFAVGGCKELGRIPQDYAAYHYFAGGSPPSYDRLDLPGKYSVVKFYERCIAGDFPLQEQRDIAE
ncbi:MAG: hypothetical protein HZB10_02730 [Candidatus Yonathbacteria bacterium]|nr:hypothetical protein [Candidatus Yonathbacteria bacterium]